MTEEEWLQSDDIGPMLTLLEQRKFSERKLRLVACACCRLVWHWITDDRSRAAIEATEKFIDLTNPTDLEFEEISAASSAASWFEDLPTHQQDGLAVAAARCSALGMHPEQVVNEVALEVFENTDCDLGVLAGQCCVLRDIVGNPFRPVLIDPAWRTATVTSLAQAIYDERGFDRMAILADALEDAGCTNAEILEHCRSGREHVRGCWVVDLLLGKE